jgi:hypothetical protein
MGGMNRDILLRRPSVRAIPLRRLNGFFSSCFLLARRGPPGHAGRPYGRAWGQALTDLLRRPGPPRRHHAGTIGLFGGGSRTDAEPGGGLGNPSGVSRLLRIGPEVSTATVSWLVHDLRMEQALSWIGFAAGIAQNEQRGQLGRRGCSCREAVATP